MPNDACLFCSAVVPWFRVVPPGNLMSRFQAVYQNAVADDGALIHWRDGLVTDFRGQHVWPAVERLVRWDARRPDVVFQRGFQPGIVPTDQVNMIEPNSDLSAYLGRSPGTVFVSAIRYYKGADGRPTRWVPRDLAYMIEYEVFANGGIDVDRTMGKNSSSFYQREIAFPGGIRPQFIRSARQYDADGKVVTIWQNPYFDPRETGETYGAKLYDLPDSTCGSLIDMRYWMGNAEERPSHWPLTASPVCKVIREPLLGDGAPAPDEQMGDFCYVPRPARASFINPSDPMSAYFFIHNQYAAVNTTTDGDKLSYGPKLIVEDWPALRAAGFGQVDAALPTGRGHEIHVFSHRKYARIDLSGGPPSSRLVSGPFDMQDAWPSLKNAGCDAVDAVLPYPRDIRKAYFFCGGIYVVLDHGSGEAIQPSRNIWDDWDSLAQARFGTLDSVLANPHNPEEAYFFYRSRYALLKIGPTPKEGFIISGPTRVSDKWASLKTVGFYGEDTPELSPEAASQLEADVSLIRPVSEDRPRSPVTAIRS